VNGTVPVNFIASNHTSGGNSGSPVLNAKGELIGLNFDRIWQGTMSDLVLRTIREAATLL
jgi:S1-C subfamily serine protease